MDPKTLLTTTALMSTTVLLTTTAMLATAALSAAKAAPPLSHEGAVSPARLPPSGLTTLYDQTGRTSGLGIVSQNFESSFDAYDCEAADDFIVPEGVKWRIKEVDILGTTFDGSGQADSMNVLFFKNRNGVPGRPKGAFEGVMARQHFGDIAVPLKPSVTLKPGHYWLAFQVNENFSSDGEWGWMVRDDQVNLPSVWRNPGGGFGTGCTDWGNEQECLGLGGDHMFVLRGQALDM
ncbi:MAG: hypothetical protein JOZ72_15700 [Alphaproteobacteria bacterium]|nr:hypothetical protein [Alphaproteobacteria bacterium]